MYYSRKKVGENGETVYQLNQVHLRQTGELAGAYASAFANEKIGWFIGLIHDIGKYSDDFQKRIQGERIETDHSSAGARYFAEYAKHSKNPYYSLAAYAVAGHHAGLLDYGGPAHMGSCLYDRLQKCSSDWAERWTGELGKLPELSVNDVSLKLEAATIGFSLAMYTRFLFSCLVDADRTDAAAFDGISRSRNHLELNQMKEILDHFIETHLRSKRALSRLNQNRWEILQQCKSAAKGEKGIFSLSVPAGGGKTLASLAFALDHGILHKASRVIYAIPFLSIIEQNAAVYADLFGRENVLESHSSFTNPFRGQKGVEEACTKLELSAEDWDTELIVTTNVQLFESLFSNNPSKLRKLHNIAGSIIILDEAQAIPSDYIRPCMAALEELVENYGCTIVLCTATQPGFKENGLISAQRPVAEIIDQPAALAERLRRTEIHWVGKRGTEQIAEQLREEEQTLCIVNTKKHVKVLFEMCRDLDTFYLTTNLYQAHRRRRLEQIRHRLAAGLPCRVIATSLVEAGVDLDFPTVYRALAGMDSLIQAAGRCNREGKRDGLGKVIVFEAEEDYRGSGYLRLAAEISRSIFDSGVDPNSTEAVEEFFHQLFDLRRESLDQAGILQSCRRAVQSLKVSPMPHFEFETMAKNFKLIKESGTALIIPFLYESDEEWSENAYVVEKLRQAHYTKQLKGIMKELAPYCVSVRDDTLYELMEKGAVTLVEESFFVLNHPGFYDGLTGLNAEGDDGMERENYIL